MVIVKLAIVLLRVVRDHEQEFGRGSHRVALWEPDVVLDAGFLEFETRTGLDLRQEAFNPDGMNTWASTLTHWKVLVSIQRRLSMLVSTSVSRFGGW